VGASLTVEQPEPVIGFTRRNHGAQTGDQPLAAQSQANVGGNIVRFFHTLTTSYIIPRLIM
jgi:hypothetical protein